MATFSRATFNAASYASYRPTYPKALYDIIFSYHSFGKNLDKASSVALDLGCGTGQATMALPAYFGHVIGTDPSSGMVEKARSALDPNASPSVEFAVAKAEEVNSVIPEGSVDLVTAAQASHWFEHDRVWSALSRVVKPGGTVAFWGYSEFRIAGRPDLTPLVAEYSNGTGPDSIGSYWEQPGRKILDDHLKAIRFPISPEWDVSSARRIYFAGDHVPDHMPLKYTPLSALLGGGLPEGEESRSDILLEKEFSWDALQSYLRTWSSLHSFHQQHPEDEAKKGGGADGDIVDRYVELLRKEIQGNALKVQWPLALIMIKKLP